MEVEVSNLAVETAVRSNFGTIAAARCPWYQQIDLRVFFGYFGIECIAGVGSFGFGGSDYGRQRLLGSTDLSWVTARLGYEMMSKWPF